MLKRPITYEDFDGNQVTEDFYFNISKPELLELEVNSDEGFGAMLQRVVATKDHKQLLERFKELILLAYGEKSEDGKRFVKSDKIREEFSQTAAYSTLFMELATNEMAGVEFLRGVLPADMREAITAEVTQNPALAAVPTPPAPPTPPNS